MATLQIALTVAGLDPQPFVVVDYQGDECLSHQAGLNGNPVYGFQYEVALASRHTDITPEQVVDKPVQLTLWRNGELVKRVQGIASAFSQGDIGHHFTRYRLTLVPALYRLSLRQNSRTFQHQTVPTILETLLTEMGVTEVSFSLTRDYAEREYCVQYRESDLAFFHRLAAEEGLVYHHEHDANTHTLIVTDAPDSLPQLDSPVPYNAVSGGRTDTPYIYGLTRHTAARPSHTALKDYSFKKPSYSFQQAAQADGIDYQRTDSYEHFDFPGRFKDDATGQAFNQTRLEFLRREAEHANGQSNEPALRAGYRVTISDHLDESVNQAWQVVRVHHQGSQPQALEEEGGQGATTYNNQFMLIPATTPWRATPTPKPQVDGPMIGTVVGPDGEEIFCDEHGRVKVHFPWDRYSNGDDKSSCWIRVAQGWAGSQYGMMAIPRIGHEVIVSFLHGDPDQPIITGRTYHATNVPPYTLPAHKTKTVWRSESHQGEGYNELTFEDQSGSEQVYLHAQKDWHTEVENDRVTEIGHDNHHQVHNDQFHRVMGNAHHTVEGESRQYTQQDQTLIVDGSLHVKAGQVWVNDASNEIHIKAGQKAVIEAGSSITVKAGGSFVSINGGGVHLVGPAINLNSGGSPGAGSGYAGKVAALPFGVESPESPDPLPLQLSPATLKVASVANLPVLKLCQRQFDGSCPRQDCPCLREEG
ncbi:type VI secretion system tip protein VgrG [Salinivibrio sp. YCSC6]|uniref:type VI secretion system Vgr family protein n=1 Tax=Salinivibrio sp. YCSC6 TaxID=2003370 RepID=UPI000BBC6630|nr:type VI secretion system tip protein VgrG [Salinivibrio sp. YCSC6]PCE65242.1 type IV secretion protein Rhs [Salinivibrio sp. YCSC6]QCF37717.1 type VI secretion system tip protein VgrG [Salinivibrio sp. YCSC6]